MMNPLRARAEKSQSVWLDFLSREIIENGALKKLIDDDGLAGTICAGRSRSAKARSSRERKRASMRMEFGGHIEAKGP